MMRGGVPVQHDPWPDVEARLDLLQAMRALTPTKRRMLDMHLAGYTHQEISDAVYRGHVDKNVIGDLICDSTDRYLIRHYNRVIDLPRRRSVYARLSRAVGSGPNVFRAMLDEVYEQSREGRARRTEAEELIRVERAKKRAARVREEARKAAREQSRRIRHSSAWERQRTFMFAESHCCLWGEFDAAMERLGPGWFFAWWVPGH